jgi:hypothetical protein
MTARSDGSTVPAAMRDVRLDFFRGLGMLIIFMAHAPGNPWNSWIPARFGFSSATELFVFCSGFASALAFGMTFRKKGFALGLAKTGKRMWEVYWAHVGLFVALAALAILVRNIGWGEGYYQEHVAPIAADPGGAILGLVTLTWLPAYLDILPMYLVILVLIPVMMLARRLHDVAPFALTAGLYTAVWVFGVNLPGNPWNGFGWFFNPLAWQLIFFIGFGFGMGWIPAAPLNRPQIIGASLAFVILAIPLNFWGFHQAFPQLGALHEMILPGEGKTDLHLLRILHFLATAYLALSLIERFKPDLTRFGGRHVVKVGQQSLASFLLSLIFARIAGVALDMTGREPLATAIINVAALVAIIACAWAIAWIKSKPWLEKRSPNREPAAGGQVTPPEAPRRTSQSTLHIMKEPFHGPNV